jgi:hypothetical protein
MHMESPMLQAGEAIAPARTSARFFNHTDPGGRARSYYRTGERRLVARLARFHFLDNVRGQTPPFPARAIEDATLTSRVTAVDGDMVSVHVEGRTKGVQKGDWSIRGFEDMNRRSSQERGLELKLLGSARFGRKQGSFVGFELVAIGARWGGTQYNCRGDELAPAPFGAVLSLAGASRAERVAPEHFRDYGGVQVE